MGKTIPTEKIEEAKAFYKELLSKKDAYINEDSIYIENKRKKIGLNHPENLANLCFALKFKENANILIYDGIIDDLLKPIPKDQFMDDIELLINLMNKPAFIQRLNIDIEQLQKLTQELIDEMKNSTSPFHHPYKKYSEYLYIDKCTAILFNEMTNQIEPQIRAKDQIDFVISLYSRFKHKGYNYHGTDEHIPIAHYKSVEQQRLRALKAK